MKALYFASQLGQTTLKDHPKLTVHLLGMTTQADKCWKSANTNRWKGLFVKELEEALLDGRDIAVHSMKDAPRYCLLDYAPVMCQREELRDVLVPTNLILYQDCRPRQSLAHRVSVVKVRSWQCAVICKLLICVVM